MPAPPARVVAVAVTWKPHPATIAATIATALPQVEALIVVDNGSTPASRDAIEAGERAARAGPDPPRATVTLLPNERNEGVSIAFNRGIELALQGGAEFVLLLDQDSSLMPGAVDGLLREYRTLSERFRVGAVQASSIERKGFVLLNSRMLDYYRRRGLYTSPTARQGLLFLNSGTMLPASALRDVGLFDERFFADFADFELSLRLSTRGYRMFHVEDAVVDHNFGPPTQNPIRLYYGVRELVRLLARYGRTRPAGLAPIVWSTANRIGSSAIRSRRPLWIAGLTLRAFFDGALGRTGEFRPDRA